MWLRITLRMGRALDMRDPLHTMMYALEIGLGAGLMLILVSIVIGALWGFLDAWKTRER